MIVPNVIIITPKRENVLFDDFAIYIISIFISCMWVFYYMVIIIILLPFIIIMAKISNAAYDDPIFYTSKHTDYRKYLQVINS